MSPTDQANSRRWKAAYIHKHDTRRLNLATFQQRELLCHGSHEKKPLQNFQMLPLLKETNIRTRHGASTAFELKQES